MASLDETCASGWGCVAWEDAWCCWRMVMCVERSMLLSSYGMACAIYLHV
jgi:hypothetical protein